MNKVTRARVLAAMVAVSAAVVGCGGGGAVETPAPTPTTPPPPPPPSPTDITINGKATFESVPYASGGNLNYAAATDKPVRGATVQLIDANGNVAVGTVSDANGDYSLRVGQAVAKPVTVRVLAELKGTNYDFAVLDNTSSGAMWGMDSAALSPAASSTTTQNMRAPSGWGGNAYTSERVAGPFAILDMAYLAKEKLVGVAPSQVFAPVSIFWSPENRPAGGSFCNGEIGTSFFTVLTQSTVASCNFGGVEGRRALFILGAENTDTDEYDTAVIAHELGHYLQSVVSRDDSLGGQHSSDDRLDMRVAFSEGWGYAWSSIVRDDPISFDSRGPQQAQGFAWSVATVPVLRGWYSEETVQYLIWNDYQDQAVGLGGVYAAMADLADSPSFTSIFSYNEALRAARPAAAAAISARSASVDVNGSDGWGTGESNSGGVASVLPVYGTHSVGQTRTYCVSVTPSIGSPNKLGNYAFVRFTAEGSRSITVSRSGSTVAPTDPDVEILTSAGQSTSYAGSTPNVESISLSLPSGTHSMAIRDYQLFDSGSTGERCFDVTIN